MLRITTSGSTGEPFTTYGDRYQLEMRFATTLRALEWTGWRFGDRQARLWHQTLGMSRSQVLRERTDAWFMRRLFVPAFEITPDHDRGVRRPDPRVTAGARRRLRRVAELPRELRDARAATRASRREPMMSSAQSLPDNVRDLIEEAFDDPRLRQVRKPRVLRHRVHRARRRATTT